MGFGIGGFGDSLTTLIERAKITVFEALYGGICMAAMGYGQQICVILTYILYLSLKRVLSKLELSTFKTERLRGLKSNLADKRTRGQRKQCDFFTFELAFWSGYARI